MDDLRITEILANPKGTDRDHEWVELCAGPDGAELARAVLQVAKRRLALTGSLSSSECALVGTGTAAIRNREADVSLFYRGGVQAVRTAGTAPEDAGFHIKEGSGFWATSTPGNAAATGSAIPALPPLQEGSGFAGLLGTAACTAGILTALAIAAFRHERDRHPRTA